MAFRLFKIGDRVILRASSGYPAAPNNPKKGSKYACVGTVESEYIWVKWDNGHRNSYSDDDLDLFVKKTHNHPLTKIFK
jgi:hypothetical protein